MTADDACQALQSPATLLGRQHRPGMIQPLAGGLGSVRGGAVSALWERMGILLDQAIPDACGAIPPRPTALESRLWAKKGRIDKADIQWHLYWHSLEWVLGQEYLRLGGNKVFLSDALPVPFIVNNDGSLSRKAAEVFFESCQLSVASGQLPEEGPIHVLELGIGVGLFAKYFLNHFRELSRRHRKDYYNRLLYIAADKSRRMLWDLCRHGVLAEHAGHYRIRLVDAMAPEELACDLGFAGQGPKPFRGVFLNYLLDCLPAAVLEFGESGAQSAEREAPGSGSSALSAPPSALQPVKQLCVRTCVARNIRLADYTDMSLQQLQERAKLVASGEWSVASVQQARKDLLEVYGLFASEYDYRPVDLNTIPFGEFGYEYAHRWTKRVLLSYGAIGCLEKLLDLVDDDGFILINDYGQTQATLEDEFEHQRFSLATFVGLNFPLLKAYFGRSGQCSVAGGQNSDQWPAASDQNTARLATDHCPLTTAWIEPVKEPEGIHSRLLGRQVPEAVREKFQAVFSQAAHDELHKPWEKARGLVKVGRFEMAADLYKKALALQSGNWVLANEIAMFLIFQLRDVKAGIDMAKFALSLNPSCSAELWNTLGDGLFEYGRTAEAKSAYQKAMSVSASDVRSRYNLAWVHVREKNFPAALDVLAKAMALDKTGEYRERLLQKQQEVLAGLHLRNQQEYLLLINLVSRHAKPGEPEKETGNAEG
jgi:tetratricopeptide (TPR) repeat protein